MFETRADVRRGIIAWINHYDAVQRHSTRQRAPIEWELRFALRRLQAARPSVRLAGARPHMLRFAKDTLGWTTLILHFQSRPIVGLGSSLRRHNCVSLCRLVDDLVRSIAIDASSDMIERKGLNRGGNPSDNETLERIRLSQYKRSYTSLDVGKCNDKTR